MEEDLEKIERFILLSKKHSEKELNWLLLGEE